MSAEPKQTLIGTLLEAAIRDEQLIENIMVAVEKNDKTEILRAAHTLAINRIRLPKNRVISGGKAGNKPHLQMRKPE